MVSVIIPTYNRAGTLIRSVQSVTGQSYSDWELIIVDDGSTDNTKEMLEPLLRQDVRLRYIGCPENKGQAAARNTGIQAAQGAYIAFQDSDDVWVYGQMVYDDGGVLSVPYPPQDAGEWAFEECLKNNLISTQTMLVSRAVFDSIGLFDTSMSALEDYELALRITKNYPVGFLSEPVVVAYKSADSVSRDLGKHLISNCMLLKKYEKDFKAGHLWENKIASLREIARSYDVVEDLEDIFSVLNIL